MSIFWICSGVVLIYVFEGRVDLGHLHRGFAVLHDCSGLCPGGLSWHERRWRLERPDRTRLHAVAQNPQALGLNNGSSFAPDAWTPAHWKPLLPMDRDANPMGVDWFAIIFGLGFVLSFGYWCTNFLVVQRAMAAKNMTAARNTPIVAAIPKMLFPALVILPGMLAAALMAMPDKNYRIPPPIIAPDKLIRRRWTLLKMPIRPIPPRCPRPWMTRWGTK